MIIIFEEQNDRSFFVFRQNGLTFWSLTKNHESISSDLRKRVGAVRRLSSALPRGKLLREVGQSLVIGKVQSSCWITRKARLNTDTSVPTQKHEGQVALNDLARILTGKKRSEHINTSDLAAKAGIPTLNEVIIRRAGLEAWKACRGGALKNSVRENSARSRAATLGLVERSSNSVADTNIANCWNASAKLRTATTVSGAKEAARELAASSRNL